MASELLVQKAARAEGGQQSAEQLKSRLYSSLLESGIIDNLKTQLRTQILRQLRSVDPTVLNTSAPPEPPALPQRILNSLFIDYLSSQGYVYTLSVFTPECGMASQGPFTRPELLHLLHLNDPASVLARAKTHDSQKSLAWELLESLDLLRGPLTTKESCSQTWDGHGGDFLESHLRSIEDQYLHKMDTERLLPYHSLEERMDQYRREVDQRAQAEIAAAVDRVRQFEVGAARMEEATRYRRQLEDAREDLERVHAERLEQLRRREESQRERLLRQERGAETAAYEQRQRMLAEMEALREREGKLKQLEEMQLSTLKLHEERLAEKAAAVAEREEDVQRLRTSLLAQAEETARLRRREVEREYEALITAVKKDRELLDVERTRFAEERAALGDELTAGRESRTRARQLERELALAQEQLQTSAEAIKDLEARLAKGTEEKRALQAVLGQGAALDAGLDWSQRGLLTGVSACGHGPIIEKLQALRAADKKAKKRAVTELEALQATFQNQVREWREQQAEWRLVERQLQARLARLQAEAATAADGAEQATQRTEELALRLRAAEREAADVTQLYREAKAALQAEQLSRHGAPAAEQVLRPLSHHELDGNLRSHVARETIRFAPGPHALSSFGREPSPPSPAASRVPGSIFSVPVVGPQTAAFSGALSRLNELQREEQHMQIALDDFRARVRAGRTHASRTVERATRPPDAFRALARREPPAESESSSSESTSHGAQSRPVGRESSGEGSGKEEQRDVEAERVDGGATRQRGLKSAVRKSQSDRSKREESGGQNDVEPSVVSGRVNNPRPPAGRLAAEGRDLRVELESSGADVKVKVEKQPNKAENEAKCANEEDGHPSQKGSVELERLQEGGLGQVQATLGEGEPSSVGEGTAASANVRPEGVAAQSQQEGRLAEASSGGGEEVQSPASVKTRVVGEQEWAGDSTGLGGGLSRVKTVAGNHKDLTKEDVKSPDTVKVLVRRKENALLVEGSDAVVAPDGGHFGKSEEGPNAANPALRSAESGDLELADKSPSRKAAAAPEGLERRTNASEQQSPRGEKRNSEVPTALVVSGLAVDAPVPPLPDRKHVGALAEDAPGEGAPGAGLGSPGKKEKGGRRSGRGLSVLEEVAKLAEREAPNAESRTATPRDRASPDSPTYGVTDPGQNSNPGKDRIAMQLGARDSGAGRRGEDKKQERRRDSDDVQSETGSVSPVGLPRGVPAWPNVVATSRRVNDLDSPAIPAERGGGTAKKADTSSPLIEDAFADTLSPTGEKVITVEKGGVHREGRTGNAGANDEALGKPEGRIAGSFGVSDELPSGPAKTTVAAEEATVPPDPSDVPKISEGTAFEPAKVSLWEKIQETARKSVPESGREKGPEGDLGRQETGPVVAAPSVDEVEEELEIDYEDAAYSDDGLSNLSIPADGDLLQDGPSGSEGW